MAELESEEIEECSCCGCRAEIKRFSCGCVKVEILDESETGWCSDCDNFSHLAHHCGKSGDPED